MQNLKQGESRSKIEVQVRVSVRVRVLNFKPGTFFPIYFVLFTSDQCFFPDFLCCLPVEKKTLGKNPALSYENKRAHKVQQKIALVL